MAKLLEVIVTSAAEALEAEAGGADRLELVRNLEVGGLTPDLELVEAVLEAVRTPVRVMLRNSPNMSAGDRAARNILCRHARAFAELRVDGLVTGFLKDDELDEVGLAAVCSAAPKCCITFHRAFDQIRDPIRTIEQLKAFPQVDRILTAGGAGPWEIRKQRLLTWQRAAAPGIQILVGAGLCSGLFMDLNGCALEEVHVGRAARKPRSIAGTVSREAVASLKSTLR